MFTVRPALQILILGLWVAFLVMLMLAIVPVDQVEYWGIDIGYYRAAAKALRYGADPFVHENLYKYADGAHIDEVLGFTYTPLFLLFCRAKPLVLDSRECSMRTRCDRRSPGCSSSALDQRSDHGERIA